MSQNLTNEKSALVELGSDMSENGVVLSGSMPLPKPMMA